MRIGIFSDIHIHNHQQFSTPKSGGLNSRAYRCLGILFQINEICEKENLFSLFFCGDFWELKGYLHTSLLIPSYSLLQDIAEKCSVVMISGQHDIATRDKDSCSAIEIFDSIEDVHLKHYVGAIGSNCVWEVYGFDCGEEFEKLPRKDTDLRFLLLHENIVGAKLDNHFSVEYGLTLEYLQEYMKINEVDYCFIGDIHHRQQLDENIWYVGNCIPKKFGEDQEKGMLIFETNSMEVEFLPLQSPSFITIDYTDIDKVNNYDYFRIMTHTRKQYQHAMSLGWNVKAVPPPKKFTKNRSNISLNTSHENSIREYVHSNVEKGRKRILKLGKEILSQT